MVKTAVIDPCKQPKCKLAATHVVLYECRKRTTNLFGKVCERHLGWGKQQAKILERDHYYD